MMTATAAVLDDPASTSLDELHLLLCEDDAPAALVIDDLLEQIGCRFVDVAHNVDEAMAIASNVGCDLAILDIGLEGAEVFPLAEMLARNRVPIVFSTGRARQDIPRPWADYTILTKPFRGAELRSAIQAARELSRRP